MFKKITFGLMAIIMFAFAISPALAGPQGPAEKATGHAAGADRGWQFSFNVQEAIGNKDAKGELNTWSNEVGRHIKYDVKYVNVNPATGEAWFAAVVTSDSQDNVLLGRWLFVKVLDKGTPGTAGDMFGWDWASANELAAANRVAASAAPDNWWAATNGNIVVH